MPRLNRRVGQASIASLPTLAIKPKGTAMRRVKYALIWCADWIVDVRIFNHRYYNFCCKLANHPWWEA